MSSSLSLSEVSCKLNEWRSSRPHARSPIPEELWKQAASLLANYSLSEVHRELGLNASKLRQIYRSQPKPQPASALDFVEVKWPLPQGSGLIEAEFERVDGAKLRIRGGSEGLDLRRLVSFFFRRADAPDSQRYPDLFSGSTRRFS